MQRQPELRQERGTKSYKPLAPSKNRIAAVAHSATQKQLVWLLPVIISLHVISWGVDSCVELRSLDPLSSDNKNPCI